MTAIDPICEPLLFIEYVNRCCTKKSSANCLLSQKSQARRAHAPAYHDFSGTVTPRGAAVQMQALMSSLQKVQLHIQKQALRFYLIIQTIFIYDQSIMNL